VEAGLNVFAEWMLDTGDKQQNLLKTLLGLDGPQQVTSQVGQNPAQDSRLRRGPKTHGGAGALLAVVLPDVTQGVAVLVAALVRGFPGPRVMTPRRRACEIPRMGPSHVPPVTEIGPRDAVLQAAFCDYVPQVFRRADFRHWRQWGEWDDDYRAFAVFEDDRVVANTSVMRMRLRMDGREVSAFQLGAVGCVPSHRGRGLARVAMTAALESCGDAPVLLFANPTVRQFYPRFGFQPWKQTLFAAAHEAVPEGPPAPTLDLEDAKVRADFAALSREGLPSTERFGARGYATVASWHVANGFARPLRQLGPHAWVSASVEGDTLYLDDVFAHEPFDLRASLPHLIDRPIRSLQFGFTPERWWPGAVEAGEDTEADLFVRRLSPSRAAHRFPVLAHT